MVGAPLPTDLQRTLSKFMLRLRLSIRLSGKLSIRLTLKLSAKQGKRVPRLWRHVFRNDIGKEMSGKLSVEPEGLGKVSS